MNLKHLPIFIEVYKTQSITKASRVFGVSKSAVSQSVGNLEDDLQHDLFIREGRQMVPTRFGQALFDKLNPLLDLIEQNLKNAAELERNVRSTIAIGVPADLGAEYVIPMLKDFSRSYPGLQFKMLSGIPTQLCELLVNNDLDFVIIDAGEAFAKNYPIFAKPLLSEEQVLACSTDYFKSTLKREFNYDDLVNENYISHVPHATEIKFWFKHNFGKVPQVSLNVKLIVDNIHSLKNGLLEGFGFGLIPKRLLSKELKLKMVYVLPDKRAHYQNRIHLCQLPGKKVSKIEKELIKYFEKVFSEKYANEI